MKFLTIPLVAVFLVGVSCERHDFEGPDGTKQLNMKHGGAHDTAGHGDHAAEPAGDAAKKEH